MTEHHHRNDDDQQRQIHLMPVSRSPGFSGRRDGLATPSDRRSNGSYETGESSSAARQRGAASHLDNLNDSIPDDHEEDQGYGDGGDAPRSSAPFGEFQQQQQQQQQQEDLDEIEELQFQNELHNGKERAHKKHRHRLTGSFLLRNPLSRSYRRQRESRSLTHSQSSGGSSDRSRRQSYVPLQHAVPDEPLPPVDSSDLRRHSDSSHLPNRPPLDIDTSLIVLMALNLSETRRIAALRNGPHATPPRLAPLPDGSTSNDLKQHLQQQRKSSLSSPRMLTNPLQPALDLGNDVQYTYRFSEATLARAQKARDHLELLAQYRRLLEILPPLRPESRRPTSSSLSISPVRSTKQSSAAQNASVELGRQYNPLQYIRNRKVRARERQTIDGERQGFGDVECVRAWVDAVYSQRPLAEMPPLDRKSSLPIFPGAEELYDKEATDPTLRTPKVRKSSADWFLEPCDMMADAYWLERYGNKFLVEDRHWNKIFPPSFAEMHRPVSGEADDSNGKGSSPLSPRSTEPGEGLQDDGESGLGKLRTDVSHGSAKERAKQKLQTIKEGFQHRQSGSGNSHDLLGPKRSSVSDLSDDENDGQKKFRPGRKGTISSNSNDLLQKQMLEMLAKEAQEKELGGLSEVPEIQGSSPSGFDGKGRAPFDNGDLDPKALPGGTRPGSPVARRGLRRNNLSTGSIGDFSSTPNLPDLQHLNAKTSPSWSRSGSPVRNPFEKIKRIIRDKGGESIESQAEDGEEELRPSRPSLVRSASMTLSRRGASPAGKLLPLTALDGSKHQRANSKRARTDDAVGLRGMFKGPRLDSVIRDGVYKLGDKIGDKLWKKEASNEAAEPETTDESDNDRVKERRITFPLPLTRSTSYKAQEKPATRQKSFLDAMPNFQHAQASGLDVKAPRVDVRGMASPVRGGRTPFPLDSDASEPESLRSGAEVPGSGQRPVITINKLEQAGRRSLGRQWSIADCEKGNKTPMVSRREVARMRALILSSGIKAMEMHRRAQELHRPRQHLAGVPWGQIHALSAKQEEEEEEEEEGEAQVPLHQVYVYAAQSLSAAIQSWGHKWQESAGRFANKTGAELRKRTWEVRTRLADELTGMTREAADEADETSRDLALGQPLKIKHVVDTMETMLRNRRRRFRWVRRGLWLTVEWLLVGFMWYVWFMVMILRIFLGVGRGAMKCVRWLLWI